MDKHSGTRPAAMRFYFQGLITTHAFLYLTCALVMGVLTGCAGDHSTRKPSLQIAPTIQSLAPATLVQTQQIGIERISSAALISIPPSQASLLDMLYNGEYTELDRMLTTLTEAYQGNPGNDQALYWAFSIFLQNFSSLETQLKTWQERLPASRHAQHALALYKAEQNLNELTEQFVGSFSLQEKRPQVLADAEKSLDLLQSVVADNPQAVSAWCSTTRLLSHMYALDKGRKYKSQLDNTATEGIRQNPASYIVRGCNMSAVSPGFGGSHSDMIRIAKASKKYWDTNPTLKDLYFFIPMDRAYREIHTGQYDKAKQTLDKAMKYGENHLLLSAYSQLYIRSRDYEKSRDFAEKAIKKAPFNELAAGLYSASLTGRAEVLLFKGNRKKALELLDQAYAHAPLSPDSMLALAGVYIRAERPRKAIDMLEHLVSYSKNDINAWRALSAAYTLGGQADDADMACQKAKSLDKDIGCEYEPAEI